MRQSRPKRRPRNRKSRIRLQHPKRTHTRNRSSTAMSRRPRRPLGWPRRRPSRAKRHSNCWKKRRRLTHLSRVRSEKNRWPKRPSIPSAMRSRGRKKRSPHRLLSRPGEQEPTAPKPPPMPPPMPLPKASTARLQRPPTMLRPNRIGVRLPSPIGLCPLRRSKRNQPPSSPQLMRRPHWMSHPSRKSQNPKPTTAC